MKTETGGMKNLNKSYDVFEFKDEDQLTEMVSKKNASKFGFSHALHDSGIENWAEENDAGLCASADAAMIDYNDDASGSFTPVATENFAEKAPELSNVVHNDLRSHGLAVEIESNIIECGGVLCCSTAVRMDDHSNCALPKISRDAKSVHLASDANGSMDESPYDIANNNASSDGHSSDKCFGGWELGEEKNQIVFYPDYMDYYSTHYLDPVDIVKIESQWSAQHEAGTVSICFISKDVAKDDIDIVHNASVRELKFLAVDSNWYKKLEAIESLDVRYKALWSVLLDTGTGKCSAFPEGEPKMLIESYFPNFDRPFDEVIYPKGDPDAVSISKSDVNLLLPDTFVNDTIIDFYIKYLRTRQNLDGTKFHFFNSFFFRKLADMDRDPSSAFDGKAAFQRVRKWTRKVNLLEKDFIFIPVNYSFHWSVIVICYFGEVAGYEDDDSKLERVPCILHMDSLRGNHVGLKDLIQSYLWEEWKERQKGTIEDLSSKFRNLKFVPLELPQQQNSFDCGLFLLHYVERFLEEVPANFSIYKIASSSKFLQEDWFPPGEASMKRAHIEKLINGLLDKKSEDCPPSCGRGMLCSPEDLNTNIYEEGVKFSVKSSPSSGSRESSLCQVGQGIEMTSLARNAQHTTTSGLVLKDLFNQGSVSESFIHASWGAFESRASITEFKRPTPMAEEEVEASECFATELAGPIFQHLHGVTPEAPAFPYSEDFRLDSVHQPVSDDVHSSPVVSGEVLNAEESQSLVEIIEKNGGDPIFLKNLPEHGQEANELQNHTPVCSAVVSGPKLDVSKCESPHLMAKSNDEGIVGVGHEWISESADEEHVAKRMRITRTELTSNLPQDQLHL